MEVRLIRISSALDAVADVLRINHFNYLFEGTCGLLKDLRGDLESFMAPRRRPLSMNNHPTMTTTTTLMEVDDVLDRLKNLSSTLRVVCELLRIGDNERVCEVVESVDGEIVELVKLFEAITSVDGERVELVKLLEAITTRD
ncbi:hypothetical protein QJS10_CPB22g00747 [Acorus calamus]|uniref:Uncharacterized protein n=1 Tax=Acorus calamus TaxID=4465 RepID=A0AAV9BXQ8_ACOCL|nr:hypothetical protein QJS10_CPB22g00747 [Acorus calamus]